MMMKTNGAPRQMTQQERGILLALYKGAVMKYSLAMDELEDNGYVEVGGFVESREGAHKTYRLTEKGKRAVDEIDAAFRGRR